jgi:hypothetical protein
MPTRALAVAISACLVPAVRAVLTNPVAGLRVE